MGDWRVSRTQARERLDEGRRFLFVPIDDDERIVVADVEEIVNVESRVDGLDLLRVRVAVLTPAMGERRQARRLYLDDVFAELALVLVLNVVSLLVEGF